MSDLYKLPPSDPGHYKTQGRECIDEMLAVFGAEPVYWFCTLNVWKYRYRANTRHGEDRKNDLAKADRYIELAEHYRELMEKEDAWKI